LYQRRPTEAVAHYERTLAVAPEHFEAAIGRFYALLEDERWQDAVDHIDALLGSSANDRWQGLSAAVTAAMARAYGDRGAQAQRRLEALERIAPLDTGLHQALATVYRWRGWSRRATDELAYALALDPEHVASRILLGHLLLDDGRYAEARHALSALRDRAPGNVHVERLGDELDASRGWGIDVRFEQGSSAGAARETPESGGTLEIRGAALGLGLRPVIGLEWSGGEFPEGELRRQGAALRLVRNVGRSSGSLGLRLDQVQPGSALAGQHFEHDDLGWAGSLGYRLSETTRIDGGFEQASRDVPIRGRRLGIEGTQTWAQFGWRPSDVASLSLRLSSLDLSDGNRREGALVLGERRVSVTPRLALTPGFELYASRGEAIATPYFNPLRDASMVGSLAIEHVLSRRYERSLRQRLSVSLGSYWQEDFGGELMFSVRYEHRWQRRPWRDLGYGIGFARRPYDGQQEERFWLFLSLGWRLR
jgi:biofilm PGA synthesis protein PgaA